MKGEDLTQLINDAFGQGCAIAELVGQTTLSFCRCASNVNQNEAHGSFNVNVGSTYGRNLIRDTFGDAWHKDQRQQVS
jgi:hypothetical protein